MQYMLGKYTSLILGRSLPVNPQWTKQRKNVFVVTNALPYPEFVATLKVIPTRRGSHNNSLLDISSYFVLDAPAPNFFFNRISCWKIGISSESLMIRPQYEWLSGLQETLQLTHLQSMELGLVRRRQQYYRRSCCERRCFLPVGK